MDKCFVFEYKVLFLSLLHALDILGFIMLGIFVKIVVF